MAVESLPWSIQGQSHPATVARNAQAALLGAPAAAVSPAVQILTAGGGHGVVSAGDFAVAQNGTPNMSVNVAAGRAFIRGTETGSLGQGVYSVFNDSVVNLSIGAADPTNPRRDLIIAQVRDANYSGASNDARLAVVAGTPAASPADPTPPANALVLARVAVAAGATSITNANITDLRTRAASLGATQVCTSSTRPSGASVYSALEIFETDTLRLLRHDGTGFVIMAEPVQSWVPTFAAGMTVGNGSWSFNRYHRNDGYVDFRGRFVFGSTSSITGDVRLNLPIASLDVLAPGQFSFGFYRPSTGAQLPGIVGTDGTTGSVFLRAVDASGTYATSVQLSNTVPFAWASGDLLDISGRYQMATRYS